jgi:hypothetical protein
MTLAEDQLSGELIQGRLAGRFFHFACLGFGGNSANADLGHVAKNGRQCDDGLPFSR